ncbi:MAG TPA: glutamate synthase large subunit, partial [bacterium]|nr:glutamate synthase large subunit [bacterium]
TKLYIARRLTEKQLEQDRVFYIPTLSSQVLSYKGLMMPADLPRFYLDLQDERLASSQCVFHQRFSTNTFPEWRLAQPFRYLAHNGEINTIHANRNWARARAYTLETPLIPNMEDVRPLVTETGSDSMSMDNMLEALIAGGIEMLRAMRLMVPPAWQNVEHMDADLRAFYAYHSMHMEPWDGPAGMVMTDGRFVACGMDRNGLRPARWVITKDRHITLASEIGVWDYAPEDVLRKGRVKPGQVIAVDTSSGELMMPDDVDAMLKNRQPYGRWLNRYSRRLSSGLEADVLAATPLDDAQLAIYEKMFQVTFEERDQILRVLAESGQEAIGSMGDDTPMAVLSKIERSPYDYFRQQFAQVTNPPIDPLRETIVMSLETSIGQERNLFEETAEHAHRLLLESPVLTEGKFAALLSVEDHAFAHHVIELNRDATQPLEQAVRSICDEAVAAVKAGKVVIVLSDRAIQRGQLPVHALLATGAVHHRLIDEGIRCNANLIIETATSRDPHHFACLIGYGATAVYPFLAFESIAGLQRTGEMKAGMSSAKMAANFVKGIDKGLMKILSKMGISTIASYRGSQLFEIIGLSDDVVELCFKDTTSRLKGADFDDLQAEQASLAAEAWNPRKQPRQGGLLKFIHGGEYHAYNPDVVQTLQQAVNSGDYATWKLYADHVDSRPVATLRDLFKLR